MQTLTTMALDVQPSHVSIGAFIETASTENDGIRFAANESIVMDRAEAIELAKAILASVEIEEVLDEDAWADEQAAMLDDYNAMLNDAQDVSF